MKTDFQRLALVGVGSELYADDAAGVLAARRLKAALGERPQLLVIDAGPAPENFTGVLRRFQPDLVILIDAADMGEPPGAVRWIGWGEVDGMSASTHRLPPSSFASFLKIELGCQVWLLGIQPGNVGLDQPMTPEVATAVARIINEFSHIV